MGHTVREMIALISVKNLVVLNVVVPFSIRIIDDYPVMPRGGTTSSSAPIYGRRTRTSLPKKIREISRRRGPAQRLPSTLPRALSS